MNRHQHSSNPDHRGAARPDPDSRAEEADRDFARSNKGFVRGPDTGTPGYGHNLDGDVSGFGRGPSTEPPTVVQSAHGGTDSGPPGTAPHHDRTEPPKIGDMGYHAFPETDAGSGEVGAGEESPERSSQDQLARQPREEDLQ